MADIDWDPELYRWEHIANVLRERIRSGIYPAGTTLSEVAVMAEFDAARGTVRQAFAAIREEGLIVTRRGKGSIVRAPRAGAGDILD